MQQLFDVVLVFVVEFAHIYVRFSYIYGCF